MYFARNQPGPTNNGFKALVKSYKYKENSIVLAHASGKECLMLAVADIDGDDDIDIIGID